MEKEKKLEKKNVKRVITIIALILIIIALLCFIAYLLITPSRAVNSVFTNLKNGNNTLASFYIDYDELINALDAGMRKDAGMSELEKSCFDNLEWTILGEKIENETAIVEVEITTKNFRQVLLNWIEKMSEKLETQEDISEEENFELLEESIKQENVQTITTTANINLEKKGLVWKVKVDENLINAIYPGVNQVLEVMEQLSSEIE